MIHIHFDQPSIQSWYADQVIQLIPNTNLSSEPAVAKDPLSKDFANQLDMLSEDEIRDILLSPMEELSSRYDWIREYIMLCDAIALYPSFREKHPGHNVCKARESYILQYLSCRFFYESFRESGQSYNSAVENWNHLKAVIRRATERRELLDVLIEQKFNYSFLSEEIRGALVEKMKTPICPYCNRQYTHSVTIDGRKRYLGDLDHVLPKSLYRLFSLSLWNLIPSCKSCNQIFKKDRGTHILNPQERGFDDDCILVLKFQNIREIVGLDPPAKAQWVIQPSASPDDRGQIENNLHIFHLNEIYNHHRHDFQRVLLRRFLAESTGYRKSLSRLLAVSTLDFPSFWYGVSLDPSKFQEEMLSKAIYDTVYRN